MALISTANANPVLASTLQKFYLQAAGFVARRLAPIFPTSQQSATYFVFNRSNMLSIPRDIARAPSTPFKRTHLEISDDNFMCTDKGIELPVDDTERAKYALAFSADEAAMRRARNIIIVNHEYRVRDLVTGTGVQKSSPVKKWDEYTDAASDPVSDVDAAKEVIHTATGLDPNLLVLPRIVYNKVKEHPKIIARYQYSQKAIITLDMLSEVFGVPILVAGGIEDGAADGQAPNPSYIWGDSVILAHVEASNDLQAPNLARTFIWTAQTGTDGISVETYRDDPVKSDIHRAEQYSDEKIVGPELGYHLENVLTT